MAPPSGSHSGEGEDGPAPASSPEDARKEAEDALARIEELADLDDDPDPEPGPDTEADEEPGTAEEAAASEPTSDPAVPPEPTSAGDGPLEDQCENCGALLHGPYCSQCGQKAADRIVPIWHMINEALEAVVELDLRVLHTMPKFLFLPGRLTKEYLNGRRTRYIRPFRLYLFATFLLFTTLALTTTDDFGLPFPPATTTAPADTVQAAAAPDTTAAGGPAPTRETETRAAEATGEGSLFGTPAEREELARRIEKDTSAIQVSDVFDNPATNARLERTIRQNLPNIIRNPWDFVGSMIDRGPYVMFLMLPIFALLLKLLYVRRGRLYVEHLIFSLHVHAHAFFAFTIGVLMGESDIGWLSTLGVWVELSPLLYLVLAMGHVYEQGLIKSTIKAFILLTIYSIILLLGFVSLAIVAFLLM